MVMRCPDHEQLAGFTAGAASEDEAARIDAHLTSCADCRDRVRAAETSDALLGSVRADNWLHIHGKLDSAQGRTIKGQIRDAFYQEKDDWKRMVHERGIDVFRRTIRGLAGCSRQAVSSESDAYKRSVSQRISGFVSTNIHQRSLKRNTDASTNIGPSRSVPTNRHCVGKTSAR